MQALGLKIKILFHLSHFKAYLHKEWFVIRLIKMKKITVSPDEVLPKMVEIISKSKIKKLL